MCCPSSQLAGWCENTRWPSSTTSSAATNGGQRLVLVGVSLPLRRCGAVRRGHDVHRHDPHSDVVERFTHEHHVGAHVGPKAPTKHQSLRGLLFACLFVGGYGLTLFLDLG
jgi:hypothetical protein